LPDLEVSVSEPITEDKTPKEQAAKDYKFVRQHVMSIAKVYAHEGNCIPEWSNEMAEKLREAQKFFKMEFYADGSESFVRAIEIAKKYNLALHYWLHELRFEACKLHKHYHSCSLALMEASTEEWEEEREYVNSLKIEKAALKEECKTARGQWRRTTNLPVL